MSEKILRPGSLRDFNQQPERRGGATEYAKPTLTSQWVAAYDRMSAAQARAACEADPAFNALADELYEKRNPRGEGRP